MYYVERNTSFEALVEIGTSGLAGTLQVAIHDSQSTVVYGPTASGITELIVGGQPTGWYRAQLVAPSVLGQYGIVYSTDGSFAPDTIATDELTVVESTAGTTLPPLVFDGVDHGPCNAWTTPEDVALCCQLELGSEVDLIEESITAASRVLWELSGRRFTGVCSQVAYPRCYVPECHYQILPRGYVVWSDVYRSYGAAVCGCHADEVVLRGYPIREIVAVIIDGTPLDPSEYELRDRRVLVRKDGVWPSNEGWSIAYRYGQSPPEIGSMAARELACELYKSCSGDSDECVLPSGVTRIQRQGIVIERNAFFAWGRLGQDKVWRTGLPLVDIFLNTYNSAGLRRRPVIVTPGSRTYPRSA